MKRLKISDGFAVLRVDGADRATRLVLSDATMKPCLMGKWTFIFVLPYAYEDSVFLCNNLRAQQKHA